MTARSGDVARERVPAREWDRPGCDETSGLGGLASGPLSSADDDPWPYGPVAPEECPW